jgi:TatD DNase family protein
MKAFKDEVKKTVDNAYGVGVKTIINVGFDLPSSEDAVRLTKEFPGFYAAVGIHPHDAKTFDNQSLQVLEEFLSDERVVAIGEIGLDYKRNLSAPDIQKMVFRSQLRFAKDKGLPIILHIRDAYRETFEILEEEKPEKILLHCFSGNKSDVKRGVEKGYYISCAGNVTYGSASLTDAVREIPLSRLLLETDAPFLAPIPYRGKRNEPSFIRFTAEAIADIKGISTEDVAECTTRNAKKFLKVEIND